MKKRKYFKKIVLLTLILLITVTFSYSSSSAKYTDSSKTPSVSYGVSFMSMEGTAELRTLNGSTTKTLKYSVQLTRKETSMKSTDAKDSYVLQLGNNACHVDSIQVNHNTVIQNPDIDNSFVNEISFTNKGTEVITYNVSCEVEKILDEKKENLIVPMAIYENIYYNDIEHTDYLFTSLQYQEDKISYDNRVDPEPPADIDKDNPTEYTTISYDDLVAWLIWYANEKDHTLLAKSIKPYLDSLNIKDSLNNKTIVPSEFNALDIGLTVSIVGDSYKFEVKKEFDSYANTYFNSHNQNEDKEFYFYTIDKDKVDETFYKYLAKYLYSDTDESTKDKYETIVNYINTEKAKNPTLENKNIIEIIESGLVHSLNSIKYNNNPIKQSLIIPNNLYGIITKENLDTTIENNSNENILRTTLTAELANYIDATAPLLTDKLLDNILISKAVNRIKANGVNNVFNTYAYYTATNDQGEQESVLVHIYTLEEDYSSNIHIVAAHTSSNIQNLSYNVSANSSNTDAYILEDLNAISNNINATDLIIKTQAGDNIDITAGNLPIGTYNSNIGEITVTLEGNNKNIIFDLNKKS